MGVGGHFYYNIKIIIVIKKNHCAKHFHKMQIIILFFFLDFVVKCEHDTSQSFA